MAAAVPAVSVLLPVYNAERYLQSAVSSILEAKLSPILSSSSSTMVRRIVRRRSSNVSPRQKPIRVFASSTGATRDTHVASIRRWNWAWRDLSREDGRG